MTGIYRGNIGWLVIQMTPNKFGLFHKPFLKGQFNIESQVDYARMEYWHLCKLNRFGTSDPRKAKGFQLSQCFGKTWNSYATQ